MRGMPRPARIIHHGACQAYHVGLARHEYGLRLPRFGNQAYGNDLHAHRLFDGRRERHLITRPHGDLLSLGQARTGDIDKVAAQCIQRACERQRLIEIPAARHPVRRRHAHTQRLVCRPRGAHRFKHFQRKAHTVFQRAAVTVATLVA